MYSSPNQYMSEASEFYPAHQKRIFKGSNKSEYFSTFSVFHEPNIGERGKRILMILISIFSTMLFFFLSAYLSFSFVICVLTFVFYYETQIAKSRQRLVSVLSFSETITPNQLEDLIVKILKFLREFEIINRGQRM